MAMKYGVSRYPEGDLGDLVSEYDSIEEAEKRAAEIVESDGTAYIFLVKVDCVLVARRSVVFELPEEKDDTTDAQ